jgi:hypothetical protein
VVSVTINNLATRLAKLGEAKVVRWSRSWWFVLGVVAVVILFHSTLWALVDEVGDVNLLDGDERGHITPFFRSEDPSVFPNDLLIDYHLKNLYPALYVRFMSLGAAVFGAVTMSKVTSLVLWLLTVIAIVATSYKVSGRAGSLFTLVLIIGSGYVHDRVIGALAHSFAMPVFAWAVYCAVVGRVVWVAALAVLGAGLYPPVGLAVAACLSAMLLLFPSEAEGTARLSVGKRCLLLSIVAGLSLALMAPNILSSPRIGADDIAQFPE